MGTGPPQLRHRVDALHGVLASFGVGQDRQQPGRPPRHAIVTPVLAGTALAQVAGHGQPEGSRQHRGVQPTARLLIASAMLGISQYPPQFPAPESLDVRQAPVSFRGGERGDLERAQYGLLVLAPQAPNVGDRGA
jgi:hypothetical protein